MKKKILILYFSGTGSTRKIAHMIHNNLNEHCNVQIVSFEDAKQIDLYDFDALVIGTPVYHAAPAFAVIDYFSKCQAPTHPIPAFIYNTRATWSCNTNRILAKQLWQKNIRTILDRDYRSPASDGSLIVPFIRRFHEFDQHIFNKVQTDTNLFLSKLSQINHPFGYIPHFRISSMINAPNKLAGQLITFPIYLHKHKCLRCGQCINDCPHRAYGKDTEGYPVLHTKNCENCYRCIHHCPAKALSLSKHRTPKSQLHSNK